MASNADTTTTRKQAIEVRLEAIEVALRARSVSTDYLENFNRYCAALSADQTALTNIRWAAIAAVYLMIACLLGLAGYLLLTPTLGFWSMSDMAKASVLVALIGSAIGLMIVMLRGSFRTISERNKDDVVPEHLKVLLQTAKDASS